MTKNEMRAKLLHHEGVGVEVRDTSGTRYYFYEDTEDPQHKNGTARAFRQFNNGETLTFFSPSWARETQFREYMELYKKVCEVADTCENAFNGQAMESEIVTDILEAYKNQKRYMLFLSGTLMEWTGCSFQEAKRQVTAQQILYNRFSLQLDEGKEEMKRLCHELQEAKERTEAALKEKTMAEDLDDPYEAFEQAAVDQMYLKAVMEEKRIGAAITNALERMGLEKETAGMLIYYTNPQTLEILFSAEGSVDRKEFNRLVEQAQNLEKEILLSPAEEKQGQERVKEIREDLKKHGFQPKDGIVRRIEKLDSITGRKNSLKDICRAYKEGACQDAPEGKLVQDIGRELQAQEQMRSMKMEGMVNEL